LADDSDFAIARRGRPAAACEKRPKARICIQLQS
jgi:hypothetical protein